MIWKWENGIKEKGVKGIRQKEENVKGKNGNEDEMELNYVLKLFILWIINK